MSCGAKWRLTVAAAFVATLCLSLVSGTQAAPRDGATGRRVAVTRTVVITTSGPVPKSVTIAVGATVRWLNATPQTQRVTADRSAFPAFSLVAGASHTYQFRATGRYPYQVDNHLQGTIIVVAAGSSSGQGGGSSSCQSSFCVFHYAASIKGVNTYKDMTNGPPSSAGRTELYLEWTGQVPDVKVTVFKYHGRVQIVGGGKGIAQATVRFIESRPLWGGPCHGNVSGRPPIDLGFSTIGNDVLTVDEHGNFTGAAQAPMQAACPGGGEPFGPGGGIAGAGPSTTSMSFTNVPGPFRTVWFVGTSSYLRIGIDRPGGRPTDYPFDLIRNGKPFTLERRLYTRTRTDLGCTPSPNCTTVQIMQYTIIFTPIKRAK